MLFFACRSPPLTDNLLTIPPPPPAPGPPSSAAAFFSPVASSVQDKTGAVVYYEQLGQIDDEVLRRLGLDAKQMLWHYMYQVCITKYRVFVVLCCIIVYPKPNNKTPKIT